MRLHAAIRQSNPSARQRHAVDVLFQLSKQSTKRLVVLAPSFDFYNPAFWTAICLPTFRHSSIRPSVRHDANTSIIDKWDNDVIYDSRPTGSLYAQDFRWRALAAIFHCLRCRHVAVAVLSSSTSYVIAVLCRQPTMPKAAAPLRCVKVKAILYNLVSMPLVQYGFIFHFRYS